MTDFQKPVRDENGRWVKGTPPANPKGRPTQERVDALTEVQQMAERIFAEHFTAEAWATITQRQIEKAIRGDRWSIGWLMRNAALPHEPVVISAATWKAIIDVQVKRALAGDLNAVKWIKEHDVNSAAK